jgi:hypothetical protein
MYTRVSTPLLLSKCDRALAKQEKNTTTHVCTHKTVASMQGFQENRITLVHKLHTTSGMQRAMEFRQVQRPRKKNEGIPPVSTHCLLLPSTIDDVESW